MLIVNPSDFIKAKDPQRRRILLVTDTYPVEQKDDSSGRRHDSATAAMNMNGVALTVRDTERTLKDDRFGVELIIVHQDWFAGVTNPLDKYSKLAQTSASIMSELIELAKPDAVHIDTEGPVGLATRRAMIRDLKLPFTTCLHTLWPDYLWRRFRVPKWATWKYVRYFHKPAARVFVPTHSMADMLHRHGVPHTAIWGRGVDLDVFTPGNRESPGRDGPILLYVGRVEPEKGVNKMAAMDCPGVRWFVGPGTQVDVLSRRHKDAVESGRMIFWGPVAHGPELAGFYQRAHVFVFPSITDTYGRVVQEAASTGLPIAGFKAAENLRDFQLDGGQGVIFLDDDLAKAVGQALRYGNPARSIAWAKKYTFEGATQQFVEGLEFFDRW